MKKVLLAFDGTHFPKNALYFARMLDETQPILLTGIFLPEQVNSGAWSHAFTPDLVTHGLLNEGTDYQAIRRNIDRFEFLCRENHIQYIIRENFSDFSMPDLKRETRFADVLLLSETFYTEVIPDDKFLKVTIEESECPVVVVPEEFDFPSTNVLAYDGSASSVYAIKQFAYLFPSLALNETVLIMMSKGGTPDKLPDQQFIEELATRHFPDLTLMKENLDPGKYFSVWLTQKKGSLLVTGSLGRSALSQLFKKSFVRDLFEDLKLPLFIAHR